MTRLVAVVTGAGSGIGAAVARRLSADHDLLLTHLARGDDLDQVVADAASNGATVHTVLGDLTASATLDILAAAIVERGQRLAVLVCNAGADPRIPFRQLTAADLHAALTLNLHTHVMCVHAVSPHMIARGHGRIIMISSVLTQVGRVDLTHYIAAKGGLEAAAHALARELGPHHITVNTVRPGSIEVAAENAVVDGPDSSLAKPSPSTAGGI